MPASNGRPAMGGPGRGGGGEGGAGGGGVLCGGRGGGGGGAAAMGARGGAGMFSYDMSCGLFLYLVILIIPVRYMCLIIGKVNLSC